ncbi:hypothetical protein [Pseudooceanicola sp. HF7]|uniref:hypothetical protein n=1 Tax=Pseudooceanicola sp. HF7 TaxID=2721560 RepID=UPI0014303037|nr:hypothetical protein [Pseudooceanicola sp. HF7]NIZ11484.1 hypothetical protein [Pseudooceanicola sp. HF7]
MTIKTQIADIRYNPADRAFEAMVTLFDKGRAYGYPLSLQAPLDMEYDEVMRRLAAMARSRHERGAPGMHSTRADPEQGIEAIPAMVQQATQALWDRIMQRAA